MKTIYYSAHCFLPEGGHRATHNQNHHIFARRSGRCRTTAEHSPKLPNPAALTVREPKPCRISKRLQVIRQRREFRTRCRETTLTFTGWLRYSALCQTCHGTGGVGSAIAPDLTQALKSFDKRQFETIVSCGLKGNLGTDVMPAWGDNPNIRPTSKIFGSI
jgi:hypothetical protein